MGWCHHQRDRRTVAVRPSLIIWHIVIGPVIILNPLSRSLFDLLLCPFCFLCFFYLFVTHTHTHTGRFSRTPHVYVFQADRAHTRFRVFIFLCAQMGILVRSPPDDTAGHRVTVHPESTQAKGSHRSYTRPRGKSDCANGG